MTDGDKENAEMMVPPPLVYGAGLLIGLGLDFLWPLPLLPDRGQHVVGSIMIGVSGALFAWVLFEFGKARTSVAFHKPTAVLVTQGPFRLSRNPSYVSLSLLYAGIGVAIDSVWVLGMLVPVLIVTHFGVVVREERYLEGKFGEEYRHYRASVRRWL